MAEQILAADEINATLLGIGRQIFPDGVRLLYAPVDDIREQDVNPQSMPKKMFDQLVENVKASGFLESIPLCALVDGVIYMVSGHHRLRAARAAGLKNILVLLYDKLSTSRVKSKQLAHNTISGKSDPDLMRRVWEQIQDVQAKFEAFVDPRVFDAIPDPVKFKPVDVDMLSRSKTILLIFLPLQALDFSAAVDAILPKTEIDRVYLANRDVFDGWIQALSNVREKLDIVAVPTAVAEMARLALEALEKRNGQQPA